MKKYSFLLFLLLIFFTISAQEKNSWDYPVKPGSEKWRTYKTGQEMVEACQIPDDVLNKLSTQELVKIILDYPLLFDYMASNDERKGISFMIENFNGLKELSKRKDGTSELIRIYSEYPILSGKIPFDIAKKTDYPYKIQFLEILIADDVFMAQLNNNEIIGLGKIVINKYGGKLDSPEIYSLYNIKKTLLLGAVSAHRQTKTRSMEQQNILEEFINNFNHSDPELLTKISKIVCGL